MVTFVIVGGPAVTRVEFTAVRKMRKTNAERALELFIIAFHAELPERIGAISEWVDGDFTPKLGVPGPERDAIGPS
jgi:hypothetical protein